jgi:hypothetical protein
MKTTFHFVGVFAVAVILLQPAAYGLKIASIPRLTYSPGKIEYFQFIRGGVGADYHQNPEFYQLSDGEVVMHWYAYDFDECSPNSVLLFSSSRDRGLSWSDPQVFMADYPAGAPSTVKMVRIPQAKETLMFFSKTRHAIEVDEERRVATRGSNYFEAQTRLFLRRSRDGGRTFDHGEELPYRLVAGGKELPGIGFYGAIDDALWLQSGRIVAAFMFMDPVRSDARKKVQHFSLACLFSDDGGRNWHRSNEITLDSPRGAMESQIVETEPDRLLCVFRTKTGYVHQSVSNDGGQSWSEPEPTSLASPESMVRMIKLQSGNLLVVWNNVSSKTQRPRHPLVAALSKDDGRTWSEPRVIAEETGANQLSNHGVIQLDDGRILLGISHYRDVRPMTSDLDLAILDEAALLGR